MVLWLGSAGPFFYLVLPWVTHVAAVRSMARVGSQVWGLRTECWLGPTLLVTFIIQPSSPGFLTGLQEPYEKVESIVGPLKNYPWK